MEEQNSDKNPGNAISRLPGWLKRLLIIAVLLGVTGYLAYINFRFLFYSAELEKLRSKKNKTYTEQKISEEEMMRSKSRAAIDKWFSYSDQNDPEMLVSLLSARWKLKKNEALLDGFLSHWIFTPSEIKQGYTGVTTRKEITGTEIISNVYGTVAKVTVENESDLKDRFGHHIIKGETVFVFERPVDKKGNKLNEVKIRDIFIKVLSDSKVSR